MTKVNCLRLPTSRDRQPQISGKLSTLNLLQGTLTTKRNSFSPLVLVLSSLPRSFISSKDFQWTSIQFLAILTREVSNSFRNTRIILLPEFQKTECIYHG